MRDVYTSPAPKFKPDAARLKRAVAPADFDPTAYPIIAQHFFGWRPVGEFAVDVVDRVTTHGAVDDDNDNNNDEAAA